MTKYMFTSFILLILLAACKAPIDISTDTKPVVSPASLDEEDLSLLEGVGLDEVFVFNLDLNDTKASRVDTWIEYYEFGEKKENASSVMGTVIQPDDSEMKFVLSRSALQLTDENQEYEKFVVSHLTDSGVSTWDNRVKKKQDVNGRLTDRIEKEITLEIGKPQTLAVMIKTNSGGIMVPDFLNDTKAFHDEIKRYEQVYLFRVELSNEGD